MQGFYPIAKRAFDIIASASALIILSPVMLIVAIIIRIDSKGPVVYRSKRVGRYYRVFDLLKFRTMYVDADKDIKLMEALNLYNKNAKSENEEWESCPFCAKLSYPCSPILYDDNVAICENSYFINKLNGHAFYKVKNDPRVTKVGKFLRRTSIDELPQLVNIFMGDMSLIGNRPLQLYEAEVLTADFSIERFNSPAGLSGLWQVTRRGSGELSERERIELDKQYSRTWSLATDLSIFFKTFPALLEKENA